MNERVYLCRKILTIIVALIDLEAILQSQLISRELDLQVVYFCLSQQLNRRLNCS